MKSSTPLDLAMADFPVTWCHARLRDVARVNSSTLSEDTEPSYSFSYVDISSVSALGDVDLGEQISFSRAPSRARRVLHDGDIIISTVRTYLRAIARIRSAEGLIASTGFAVVSPTSSINADFLFWWLNAHPFVEQVVSQSVGVSYPAISATDIAHMLVPVPPRDEQERIGSYLGVECSKIDKLIAEQEHQRTLLEERRSALITLALSGAHSQNSTSIESGVPWIGKVPSHWEVKRLKHVGRSSIGLTYSPADVVSEGDEGMLVLRSGNIQEGRILFEDNVYVRTIVPQHLITREGDILICARNGSARLIGKCAVLGKDAQGMTWGAFMTVFRSHMNPYLAWVLRSTIFSQQLGLFATSTINQLTNTTLHNFYVPIPPEDERASIVARLDRECGQIDDLLSELNRSEQLLVERKRAVITAAVTGQMGVV